MLPPQLTRRLFWVTEGVLLLAATGAAVALSRSQDWHPLALVGLLLALALVAERIEFEVRGQHLSASLVVLVLAMSLLGPAPAVALGLVVILPNSFGRRLSPSLWLGNLSAFAAFTLVGALIVRALVGDVHSPQDHHLAGSVTFALVVFGVFMVTNALNFAIIAADARVTRGLPLGRQTRELFLPLQPGQMALGALTALLAIAYFHLGLSALLGLIVVLLLFQYLIAALLRSEDRA